MVVYTLLVLGIALGPAESTIRSGSSSSRTAGSKRIVHHFMVALLYHAWVGARHLHGLSQTESRCG
jgi:succinate dehydrogenase hydrophobic anchor subunit